MEERNSVVIKTAGGTDFGGLKRPEQLKNSSKLGSASFSSQKGRGGRGYRYGAGQRGGKNKTNPGDNKIKDKGVVSKDENE